MLIILNTQNVWAEEFVKCPPPKGITEIDKLSDFSHLLATDSSEINWWAASSEQIQSRKCKEAIPTLNEIEDDINARSNTKAEAHIKALNVEFENESPELVEAFKKLLTKEDIFGKIKSFEDVQKNLAINPGCKKVKCAVEKIFGKELGNKILYLNLKYGFNSSEYAFDSTSRLEVDEINNLLAAASAFPASRFPMDKNKQLTRFKKGYTLASHDEDTIAYAAIAFYDKWTKQKAPMREYTAFHEMSHYIGSELKLDANKVWLDLSGWVEKDGKWTSNKKDSVSSEYGATNPAEDFAESASAYRYNPQLLKKLNPEKYQFLKETVFDGLEYLEDSGCNINNSIKTKLLTLASAPQAKRTQAETISLIQNCGEETRDYILFEKGSKNKLYSCFTKSSMAKSMEKALGKLNPPLKYPELAKSNFPYLSPETVKKFNPNPENFQDAKSYLREELINNIMDWDKTNYFYYKGNDAAVICKKIWNEYSYQAIFSKNKTLEDSVSPYSDKIKFQNFLEPLCEKIHKGKNPPKLMTRIEVENNLPQFP